MNAANPVRAVSAGFIIFLGVIAIFMAGSLVETLGAGDIMVIQYLNGHLRCETQPGMYGQWLGTVTKYRKQETYAFSTADDQEGQAIPVQFADGAHGKISGTVAWQMPMACPQVITLHSVTGSQRAVEQRFIRPVTEKAVYFAGPLMTSKESYSERKGELLSDIEDQITNGVYKTNIVTKKEPDPITGLDKTVSQVVRTLDTTKPLGFGRQDTSPLTEYGIRTYNLEIKVAYDKAVEDQIQEQQKLAMSVQTAMAAAKQAEQRALTVEKEGQANAAKAKWEQEVVKAKNVTEAESRLAVARTNNDIEEQNRQALLKKADGEATYRKKLMDADNALDARLKAAVQINQFYADAIKNHQGPWVPNVVMGSSTNGGGGAADLMNLLTIQAAKAVGLEKH
jgi:regulator of protease activity HflC (stomatin/prohibitin superfamily)